jgi:cytochrome P450
MTTYSEKTDHSVYKPPVEDFSTDWDHTDPTWVKNPYPIWEALREQCPVAHTNRFGGGWFPVTHDLVSEVANDTTHFTSRTVVIGNGRPGDDAPPAPIGVVPPISSDPPFHQIARRIILPALAPKVVNALEPRIRELCVELLDRVAGHSVIDGSMDYAANIPPTVVELLLGLPREDEELFRRFIKTTLEGVDEPDVEKRMEMFQPIEEYITKVVEDHMANPQDDLVSYLLNVEVGGQKLAPEHIFGTVVLVLIAGIDTTWSAIGASIWHLAQNPQDLKRLVDEPELLPVAVEEFLRFYAPVSMARLVKEDFDFHGCPMKKDDWLLLGFPAANRDPEAFEDADKFIIDRQVNRHLAFGLGIHRCAGSNLARLEMTVALEEFIKRYPRFELAAPDEVTWSQGQVRGPRQLPLKILA